VTAQVDWPRVATDLPGPKSAELLARLDAVASAPLTDHDEVPFVEDMKVGSLIRDVDGNVFADHVSAWGCTPFGASCPEIIDAVVAAQQRYGMEISDYIPNRPAIELADRLLSIAPEGISRFCPGLSGTLAVEAGVKLARESTGRPMILTFLGQYHGEGTYLTASASTDLSDVTSHSSQYVGGLIFAPYPNSFRAPFHHGPGPYDDTMYVDYLEEWLLVHQVEPEQIAGVLIEPILGEGGILIPSGEFWRRLTSLCSRWGWKLILDEVQTGMGRCGTIFASERWDLRPDIVLLGKGFAAGGAPIAAVLGTDDVLASSDVRGFGTCAWTPTACAGALAGIEKLLDPRTLANVADIERVANTEFRPLVDEIPQVGDVRIAGAFIGIEFVVDKESIMPAPAFHAAVHQAALRRGVLGITQWGKWVYRLQPALTMPIPLFEWSCRAVADAIREVAENPPRELADLTERVPPTGGTRRR